MSAHQDDMEDARKSYNRPDGGPAFPALVNWTETDTQTGATAPVGMTLRDWFAGQALPNVMQDARDFVNPSTAHDGPKVNAELSYAIADAMLAERSK